MRKNGLIIASFIMLLAACAPTNVHFGDPTKDGKMRFKQALARWERQDYAEAVPLMQSAVGLGEAAAGRYVGLAYLNGYGDTVQSPISAFLAFEKAANAGDVGAQYWLGYLYEQGIGTRADVAQAKKWYAKAAQQGNAEAKQALAQMRILPK